MTFLTLLGAGMSAAGVLLLWRAWRLGHEGRQVGRRISLAAGWSLLAACLLPWARAAGADRGPALALLAMMLTAGLLLAAIGWREAARRGRRRERERPANGNTTAGGARRLLPRRVWIFLLAGPLSAAAAFLLSLVFYYGPAAGWDPANRLAGVLLFAPAAWALLSVASTYDSRLLTRSALLGGLVLLGLAGLWLTPGGAA